MTAEVAIANKSAVVVAADSAVTIGTTRVHRSSNKIFSLSDSTPIGVVIFGQAELAGMPWETIFKLFRGDHGSEKFKTVQECADRLRAYLTDPRFHSEEGDDRSLAQFSLNIIEMVRDRVDELPKTGRTRHLESLIEIEAASYDDFNKPMDFKSPTLGIFKREFESSIIIPIVDEIFGDLDVKLSKRLFGRFTELVHKALNSSYMSEFKSGVVVFGFGTEELFPMVLAYEFDGIVLGEIRSLLFTFCDVKQEGPTILPLADREVMDTLIQGSSAHLITFFLNVLNFASSEIVDRVLDDNLTLTDDEKNVAKGISQKAIDLIVGDYTTAISEYVHSRYALKMVTAIENMPKEDLAVLAEALVEVTGLRIKASDDIESVGGPVDVCVVTKGDGFIWIKRKHYFDLASNIQYLVKKYGDLGRALLGGSDDKS